MSKITIDRALLEQALEALNHGITEMNHRGCAIECMSLHHATKAIREELAQPQHQSAPAGYVLVPNSLIDKFPEINPSNYGHDDACALNRWGCEVVTAAIERHNVPIQCEREAFETWASRQQGFGCAANPVDYTLGATRDAWEVWQARAAIERQSVPTGWYITKAEAMADAEEQAIALAAAPQPEPVQQFELTEYDAGLLNDFGGGNVEWWQDYIRAELGRAYEHYQSQIPAPQPQPVPPAQPPSDEQIADAYEATVSIQNHLTWAAYRAGARYAETQHGITKGKT